MKEFEKVRNQVNILFEHLIVETKKMSKKEVALVKKFVDMNYELGKEHKKKDVSGLIEEIKKGCSASERFVMDQLKARIEG